MFALTLFACTGEVVGPDGDGLDTADQTFAIHTLDPTSGPAAGDTLVRVTGAGFTTATTVLVGGTGCATLTFLSAAEFLCVTPPGPVGEADFVATDGAETDVAAFTYLAEVEDTAPPDTGAPPLAIDGCVLTVAELTMEEDNSSPEIGAVITVFGRTDAVGQGVGVDVQLGYGTTGTDSGAWAWTEAYYSADSGDADVYDDAIYVTNVGRFDFAMRARVDHGDWTECLSDVGSYGAITVTPTTEPVPVDYCHLQYPCATTALAGAESEGIYAWIYQAGYTDRVGAGPGIEMDVGVGPTGTDPEVDAAWAWVAMAYNEDKDGLFDGDVANDEYMGAFIAPATPGAYEYVVRASADHGLSYTLCDLGGDSCNYGGSSDGYDDPGTCTVQ